MGNISFSLSLQENFLPILWEVKYISLKWKLTVDIKPIAQVSFILFLDGDGELIK